MWRHLEVDGYGWLPEPDNSSSLPTDTGDPRPDSVEALLQDAGMGANMGYSGALDTASTRAGNRSLGTQDENHVSEDDQTSSGESE